MPLWRSTWIALAALLAGLPLTGRAETLSIYGDDSYAPVIYLDKASRKPAGFLVDLLRRAEAYSGDRYVIEVMPWKRAYVMAQRGQAGLIGVSFSQERATQFDFSRPIYNDDIHVVVLRGKEFPLQGLADLRGKLIGGVIGASYGETVDRAIAGGVFKVDRDVGQTSRLRKLLAGRLDGALVGNGPRGFEAVVQSHPELMAHRDELVLLPVPVTHDPLHLAFPKSMGKSDALVRFDAAMARVMSEAPGKR
jgi:polar amino acid transport system substrate-binding protein